MKLNSITKIGENKIESDVDVVVENQVDTLLDQLVAAGEITITSLDQDGLEHKSLIKFTNTNNVYGVELSTE